MLEIFVNQKLFTFFLGHGFMTFAWRTLGQCIKDQQKRHDAVSCHYMSLHL